MIERIFSLIRANDLQAAENMVVAALALDPNNHGLLNAYGLALQCQNRFEEAIQALQQAIKLAPQDCNIWINLGNIHLNWKNPDQALACFNQALHIKPDNAIAALAKAKIYMESDCYIEALEVLHQALSLSPKDLKLLMHQAAVLHHLRRYDELITVLEEVSALSPNDHGITQFLGDLYSQLPWKLNYDKALKCYEKLYEANPSDLESLKRMCFILNSDMSLSGQDNLSKAHPLTNKLLELEPINYEFSHIIQNIALRSLDYNMYNRLPPFKELLSYWAGQSALQVLADQSTRVVTLQDRLDLMQALQQVNEQITPGSIKRRVRQKLNNKIRLGIISPNFMDNCVGYFIWPLVEHLDKEKFELYCYSTVTRPECILASAIIGKADVFRKYDTASNSISAQDIADDCVDALLEVSVIARQADILAAKPAPIQITWLDSTAALGMPPSVDYLDYVVVDPYIQSPHPEFSIKKPMMLPHTWVALGSHQPLLCKINDETPEDRNGYITLGTMNSVLKLTAETLALWAEIMHMLPNSRFLYVRPETAAQITRDNFRKHMASHGIAPERISFVATRTEHMSYYNNIDIALDTFPRTGGTTTCEAIMMGVPVITLVGLCLFERISYSNLSNVGLGDLCAFNLEEYKDIAIKLAYDKERRRHLRGNLRQQAMQSPLGNAQQFVEDFSTKMLEVMGK